ncbi:MAG TPA: hypothetical protein O0X66_02505 [Methanocorpusculum sp.]|nr:hypothetical protein [Methanocorpusculum sp.]HJJ53356.1 hypothetical protein [Methanocorpusculum sp.]
MPDVFIHSSKLDRFQRRFTDNTFYFISLKLELHGDIDLDRLERAVAKVADAVKILKSYYNGSPEDDKNGWVLLSEERKWVTETSSDPANIANILRGLPNDHPPLHVVADKKGPLCTLIFSIDHTLTDAHGLWDVVGMIGACYRILGWNPNYTQAPLEEWGDRSMRSLLASYSMDTCAELCRAESAKRIPIQKYQKMFAVSQDNRGVPTLFVQKIQPQVLKNMKTFAHKHHATVNDVLITVYAVALQEYVQKTFDTSMSMVPIRAAVDLRKYLPLYLRTDIKNYSVPYWSPVPIPESGDIISILDEVRTLSQMDKKNALGIGVQFAIEEPDSEYARPLLDPEYESSPFMSNAGVLPKDVVDFGNDVVMKDAVMYGNISTGNPFVIVVITWEDTLSLSIFSDGEHETADQLLKRMSELIGEL